jgi:hypothetical protein
MSTTPEQQITAAIANKKKTASKADRKAKVAAQTNVDDTFGSCTFVFLTGKDDKGKTIVGDGSLNNAPRYQPIKVKRSLLKIGRIDVNGVADKDADTIESESTGRQPRQTVSVSFGSSLRPRKTTKGSKGRTLSAKYYSKNWLSFGVPTSATSMDVIAWIKKCWGVQPLELRMGKSIYVITKRKKAINDGKSASRSKAAQAAAATAGKE